MCSARYDMLPKTNGSMAFTLERYALAETDKDKPLETCLLALVFGSGTGRRMGGSPCDLVTLLAACRCHGAGTVDPKKP